MNAEEIKAQIRHLLTGLMALHGRAKTLQFLQEIMSELQRGEGR